MSWLARILLNPAVIDALRRIIAEAIGVSAEDPHDNLATRIRVVVREEIANCPHRDCVNYQSRTLPLEEAP